MLSVRPNCGEFHHEAASCFMILKTGMNGLIVTFLLFTSHFSQGRQKRYESQCFEMLPNPA